MQEAVHTQAHLGCGLASAAGLQFTLAIPIPLHAPMGLSRCSGCRLLHAFSADHFSAGDGLAQVEVQDLN